MKKVSMRIGIFAGTFDPIHTGHLALALKAIKAAELSKVYFLPERRPRQKPTVEHFGHRTAMITRAIRPYTKLGLLELPDIHFDIKHTLPKLKDEFKGSELVFIMGSDVAMHLKDWAYLDILLDSVGLVVVPRAEQNYQELINYLEDLTKQPKYLKVIEPVDRTISSTKIREAFRKSKAAKGLLPSVKSYAQANWLYVSLAGE